VSPTRRPSTDEHAPYYARYIALVPDGSIVEILRGQITDTVGLLAGLPDARARHRYAPGKWSVKEVLGHVCDGERVFAYRALRIGRGDATPLPGFDENGFAAHAPFDTRPLADVIAEFESVRGATLTLLGSLDEAAWSRRGVASGHPVTVRALAWIIAGHELHHRAVLAERYLSA
jgi:uncharacterized damage-inducible protein DinB